MAQIQLAKVTRVRDVPTVDPNFVFINTVNWFTNNVQKFGEHLVRGYELSPYYLKNSEGCLMENIWQSSKIYPEVLPQKQIHVGIVTWEYPGEKHIIDNNITPEYFNWRQRLLHNKYPVRYPNGYALRKTCAGIIWPNADGEYVTYDYLQARKQVYVPVYAQLVRITSAYVVLRDMMNRGINLTLSDVDVPDKILVTKDSFNHYLTNPELSFGHSWTLAACLLGLDVFK